MAQQGKTNAKGDSSFYGDWDEETGMYCVFGDNSGFAYSSWATAAQADHAAIFMNAELARS